MRIPRLERSIADRTCSATIRPRQSDLVNPSLIRQSDIPRSDDTEACPSAVLCEEILSVRILFRELGDTIVCADNVAPQVDLPQLRRLSRFFLRFRFPTAPSVRAGHEDAEGWSEEEA